MPKFSQQRILKSKEVLCSYFNKKFDNFLFEQKIKEEAYNRTLLLADENSDDVVCFTYIITGCVSSDLCSGERCAEYYMEITYI